MPFEGIFGTVLVDLARQVVIGVIRGMVDRYSVEDLRYHIDNDTNLVEEAFRSPYPEDRATVERLRALSSRYSRYGPKIRGAVTPEWFMAWLWKRHPRYAVVVDAPKGRAWMQKNLDTGIKYFFGS